MDDLILIHHGIKGQKWGTRNGPPYPLDYEDHNAAEKRENSKSSLNNYENHNDIESPGSGGSSSTKTTSNDHSEQNSNQEKKTEESEKKSLHDRRKEALLAKGLSEEEAEAQIQFENRAAAIAIGCAAVVGASVAYNLVSEQNIVNDFTLSGGTEMYRVASSDSTEMRDMFYATTNKIDATKYAGMYAQQKQVQAKFLGKSKDIYQKVLSSKSDIKVAGSKTAKEVYEQLYKTDPDFKKANFGLSYDAFNKGSIMSDKNSGENKKFFEALQAKGYGGVIDINDAKYSGYEANKPVILFNQQSNVNVNSVRKLSDAEINRNTTIGMLVSLGQGALRNTSMTGTIVTYAGVSAIGSAYAKSQGLDVDAAGDTDISTKKKKNIN